jgi:ribosomal protein L24, bacterial/organelle
MKVKVGDTVNILTGKDKGKSGKVIKTLKTKNKVVVEGINIIKKHSKPTNTNDKGGIFDIEAPIHVSNVKVVSEKEVKKVEKAKVTKTAKKEEKVEEKAVAKKAPAKKTTKKVSK